MYYVVAKFRSTITLADLTTPKLLQTFSAFNSLGDATDFKNMQFFDDCDYGIFKLIKNVWHRKFTKWELVK